MHHFQRAGGYIDTFKRDRQGFAGCVGEYGSYSLTAYGHGIAHGAVQLRFRFAVLGQ